MQSLDINEGLDLTTVGTPCHHLCAMQELKAFLTVEGSLADNYQWRQLQPMQSSVLEGIARLPKQLMGEAPPLPTCLALNAPAAC